MKSKKIIVILSLGLFANSLSQAQSTFENLNFELANPVVVSNPNFSPAITAASALPGWTVTLGGVPQADITSNLPALGSTWVMLVGPGPDYYGIAPIDGNYSVLLQGGQTASNAAISQTGLIPSGTQTILVEASQNIQLGGPGTLQLFVGSQPVALSAVGTGSDYTLYAANISQWSGDTEQITFSASEGSGPYNNWILDDISFSPSPVPEPSIVELTAFGGGLLLGARRWLARRQ